MWSLSARSLLGSWAGQQWASKFIYSDPASLLTPASFCALQGTLSSSSSGPVNLLVLFLYPRFIVIQVKAGTGISGKTAKRSCYLNGVATVPLSSESSALLLEFPSKTLVNLDILHSGAQRPQYIPLPLSRKGQGYPETAWFPFCPMPGNAFGGKS